MGCANKDEDAKKKLTNHPQECSSSRHWGVPGPRGYLVRGYLVWGGVPGLGGVPDRGGGVPGPGVGVPGQGGVPGPGGCTWSWGVPGPGGYLVPGGTWSQVGTWSRGGFLPRYSPTVDRILDTRF